MKKKSFFTMIGVLFGFSIIMICTGNAYAHCDSYDGPVIKDAQLAIDQKDVTPVLKWVTSRFHETYERKQSAGKTVKQGREYVESYVQFTHFAEAIHQLVSHGASHKHQQSE